MVIETLDLDVAKVNPKGGAIALGCVTWGPTGTFFFSFAKSDIVDTRSVLLEVASSRP